MLCHVLVSTEEVLRLAIERAAEQEAEGLEKMVLM